MTDTAPPRLTLRQRWHRLRTSPRFPFVLFFGLLVAGGLSQVYCYWWDFQIEEMLKRNKGYCERINVYPFWMRKYLGAKFVPRLEPIHSVRMRHDMPESVHSEADDFRLLRGALFLNELNTSGKLSSEDVGYLKWQRGLRTARFYNASEAAVDVVEKLPRLTSLELLFADRVSLSAFRRIAAMSQLTRLSCYFQGQANHGPEIVARFRELAASTSLTRLDVTIQSRQQFLALTSPLPDGSPPFPELRELRISGTRGVAPADLDQLRNLPNLIHLELSFSNITDAHLPHLKPLPFLRTLYLESNPRVTDAGAEVLASMTNLQSLNVKRTSITKVGLHRLATLPRLRCLRADIGGREATAEFRKLLPAGCELDTN